MTTLFENDDFRLLLTGHDYDFVGIIETKTEKPLTFFFSEELFEHDEYETDGYFEDCIDESKTKLLDVYEGLEICEDYDNPYYDEEQAITEHLGADSSFRTRDDKSTGFLSYPRQRGQFLALVKNYCPERLKEIEWA